MPWTKQEKATTTADVVSDADEGVAETKAETKAAAETKGAAESQEKTSKAYTPKKGKATPKRNDQERKHGVRRSAYSAPKTPGEARKQRKELKASMSKEEWKAYKRKEREENRARNKEAQERMAAGDERYLLARDKGDVRRYVRNWVDSRRFLNEWVMLFAVVLFVLMFVSTSNPNLSNIISIVAMICIVVFAVEGFWLSRKCNNAVRLKFPGTTEAGFGLGFYAYSRATQPRKWRTPRPQVERGATV